MRLTGGGLGLVSSDQTAVTGPVQVVRYEGETALAANLPMARDLVNTAAGAAELADDPNTDATETAFRPAVAAAATRQLRHTGRQHEQEEAARVRLPVCEVGPVRQSGTREATPEYDGS